MALHNIKTNLSSIAKLLDGTLKGNDVEITGLCTPEEQSVGCICIIAQKQMLQYVKNSMASAFIIIDGLNVETSKPYIVVKDVKETLVKLLNFIYPVGKVQHSISINAYIGENVNIVSPCSIGNFVSIGNNSSIGKNTKIYSSVVIGDNVCIGENCIIYPNVTIYDNIIIGSNVIIHAGVVIGADGFGFIPGANPTKIPQKGTVVIEDYVEIGANSCIDRATIGSTIIGFGTKLDNLVMVGHNTQLGRACLIASQVGFSGSIKVGDYVVAGGQTGFSDHINIATGSMFGGQSGVANNINKKGMYMGSPCMEFTKFAKSHAVYQELPEIKRRIKDIGK